MTIKHRLGSTYTISKRYSIQLLKRQMFIPIRILEGKALSFWSPAYDANLKKDALNKFSLNYVVNIFTDDLSYETKCLLTFLVTVCSLSSV